MSLLLATVIEVDALAETALASLVAGVVVTLSFSLGILGTTRATDLRQSGREFAALLALAGGIAALLISVAAVGLGLVVMING